MGFSKCPVCGESIISRGFMGTDTIVIHPGCSDAYGLYINKRLADLGKNATQKNQEALVAWDTELQLYSRRVGVFPKKMERCPFCAFWNGVGGIKDDTTTVCEYETLERGWTNIKVNQDLVSPCEHWRGFNDNEAKTLRIGRTLLSEYGFQELSFVNESSGEEKHGVLMRKINKSIVFSVDTEMLFCFQFGTEKENTSSIREGFVDQYLPLLGKYMSKKYFADVLKEDGSLSGVRLIMSNIEDADDIKNVLNNIKDVIEAADNVIDEMADKICEKLAKEFGFKVLEGQGRVYKEVSGGKLEIGFITDCPFYIAHTGDFSNDQTQKIASLLEKHIPKKFWDGNVCFFDDDNSIIGIKLYLAKIKNVADIDTIFANYKEFEAGIKKIKW